MKRYGMIWLVVALCLALAGSSAAALADDQVAMPLEVELGEQEQAPSDESQALDMSLDLGPDVDLIDVEPSGTVQTPPSAQGNAAESNKLVSKKFVVYEIVDGEASVVSADRSITEAIILESVNGYPVTNIAAGAFADCKKLWQVIVPDSVTEIGESAFLDCPALVDVQLSDSVGEIGEYAFKNCTSISHFVLPEGLQEIKDGTFENCQIMWKIAIPSSIKVIGNGAFRKCLALKEFALPDGLEEIGESAFEGCESMIQMVIPDGIEEIYDNTFMDCKKLRKLSLPTGLISIGDGAFFNCNSLKSLKLPYSLESIGALAFACGDGLKKLTIPDSVDSVGYGAFYHCSDLEEVTLESGIFQLESYCFAQCKDLVKVMIPESVKTFGDDVFSLGSSSRINDKGEIILKKPLSVPKKLKIYSRPNSKAASYASEYKIPFVAVKIVATSVSIEQGSSATLYMGETLQLTAKQKPENAETTVRWKSNSSVVKVSKSGLVTPKRSGKATVTVITENGKKASIIIKVIDAKSVSIAEGKTATMKVGEELQLHAIVLPDQVTTKLTWTSGSRKVASVSGTGLVTAKKKGTATITVKTANGKKAKIKITVTE